MPTNVAKKRVGRSAVGRPRRFQDAELVDAALRVMDREGYKALSIRSLASELGTTHPTLYTYVSSIEEIEARALHRLGTERLDVESAARTLGVAVKYREDADRVRAALDRMLAG